MVTITNGTAEEIISEEQASIAASAESDVLYYLVHTDAAIRVVQKADKDQIRHAFPIAGGTTFSLDPHGYAVYAYADGVDAEVSVYRQVIEIGGGGTFS